MSELHAGGGPVGGKVHLSYSYPKTFFYIGYVQYTLYIQAMLPDSQKYGDLTRTCP
jgi:hypothetical protein